MPRCIEKDIFGRSASLQAAPSPQVNAVLHYYKKKTTLALVNKCAEKCPHLYCLLRATLKKPPVAPIQQGRKMDKMAYSHAFLTLCLTSLAKGTGYLHLSGFRSVLMPWGHQRVDVHLRARFPTPLATFRYDVLYSYESPHTPYVDLKRRLQKRREKTGSKLSWRKEESEKKIEWKPVKKTSLLGDPSAAKMSIDTDKKSFFRLLWWTILKLPEDSKNIYAQLMKKK